MKELAQRLDEARRDAREIEQLTAHVKLTEADGYTIQDALLALETAGGARQIGWKLGLTSVAKQEQVGVHTPIHGFLLDRMLHPASETPRPGSSSSGKRACLPPGSTCRPSRLSSP